MRHGYDLVVIRAPHLGRNQSVIVCSSGTNILFLVTMLVVGCVCKKRYRDFCCRFLCGLQCEPQFAGCLHVCKHMKSEGTSQDSESTALSVGEGQENNHEFIE